jgi:hypothetical protein
LPLRGLTSLYKEPVHPFIRQRSERGQRLNPISSVSCVYSVVIMGRETGSLQLLAPLLLTGGKGADLVIRGNVVLNTLSACSTSTLLRIQSAPTLHHAGRSSGLAELSYATVFDPSTNRTVCNFLDWIYDLVFNQFPIYSSRGRNREHVSCRNSTRARPCARWHNLHSTTEPAELCPLHRTIS